MFKKTVITILLIIFCSFIYVACGDSDETENTKTNKYEMKTKEINELSVLIVKFNTTMSKVEQEMGKGYDEIFGYLGELQIQPSGIPFAMYYDEEFKEEEVNYSVCVPIEKEVNKKGRIKVTKLPQAKVVYTTHIGPYQEIGPAYCAITNWVQEHGHQIVGPYRELYITDPQEVKDPKKFVTEVALPIK